MKSGLRSYEIKMLQILLLMHIFKRAYKKLHSKERIYIGNLIQVVTKDPKIRELKKAIWLMYIS